MIPKDCVTFKLDGDYQINFLLEEELDDSWYSDKAKVVFKSKRQEFILYNHDFLFHTFNLFFQKLKIAANKKLELDKSIKEDIGYLWNEYLHSENPNKDKRFLMFKSEGTNFWIGHYYLLWSYNGVATWFYNKNGKIYFHITPVYKWHFDDPEPGEDFISYEKFIKNYKPYFNFEIKKDIAEGWIKRAEAVIELIS